MHDSEFSIKRRNYFSALLLSVRPLSCLCMSPLLLLCLLLHISINLVKAEQCARSRGHGGTQASVASHAQRQLIKAPRIAHKLVISITQFQCQHRERAGSPLLALALPLSPSLCFFPSHFELLLSFTVACEFCSNFQSIMLMRIYVMAYEAYPHTHSHTHTHEYQPAHILTHATAWHPVVLPLPLLLPRPLLGCRN